MDDLISRQAAIDALDVLCQEHRYKIPGKLETYSQYNEAWQDALDRAEGAIGNLPSAQPGWIPCSTEMPPTGKDVLVTLEGGTVTDGERWEPQEGKWFLFGGGVNGLDEDVIAWCPLPAPYRPEGEEHGKD